MNRRFTLDFVRVFGAEREESLARQYTSEDGTLENGPRFFGIPSLGGCKAFQMKNGTRGAYGDQIRSLPLRWP